MEDKNVRPLDLLFKLFERLGEDGCGDEDCATCNEEEVVEDDNTESDYISINIEDEDGSITEHSVHPNVFKLLKSLRMEISILKLKLLMPKFGDNDEA